MSDSHLDILDEVKQLLFKGEGQTALKKINSLIDSKSLAKLTKLSYQIFQAKALTQLDDYYHATSILDEIEEIVFKTGDDFQKLDFIICKIENLLIFGKTDLGMELNKKAEKILQNIADKETDDVNHRKIDLLILQSKLISNVYGYIEKLFELLDMCLRFSIETNYNVGKAHTLERLFDYYIEIGNRAEAEKCVDVAYELWVQIGNKRGLAYNSFLKGLHLIHSNPEAAIKTYKQALSLSQELEAKLTESKVLNSIGCSLFLTDKKEEGLKYLNRATEIKRKIGDKPGLITILYNIGQLYITEMDSENALKYLHEGLSLSKEIDFQRPYYLIQYALNTLYMRRGELNRALKFLEEAIDFFEEKNLIQDVAWSRERLADILVLKGDLKNALQNYILSQEYYEKEDRLASVCIVLNNIAEIHHLKGDYELALKYYKRGENLATAIEYNSVKIELSFNLLSLYLDLDRINEAEKYLERMKEINQKEDAVKTTTMINLARVSLIVKKQDKEKREEAKKLLKKIIDEEHIERKFLTTAILNLCEILLVELRETEDLERLEELKLYVERLHKEGSAELAYPLLVHAIWLQANISLLELDVIKARRLLKSAQVMAEAKEFYNLARRISNYHDILLSQLKQWDEFTYMLPNIAERMELTHIETVLNEMIKGKGIIYPEDKQEKEDPLLVSIFSTTGSVLYLERIDSDIDPDMIEEIWVKVLKNVKEEDTKAGIIERMKIRDYTYVVKKIEKLVFCYIFIGHSYEGIKKLEEFSQLVYGTAEVWEELEELSKISLSTDFDIKTLVSAFTEETALEYTSNIILNQYVDNVFL